MNIKNIIGLNLDIPVWLLMLLSIIVLYYVYMTWHFDTFTKMGVPGPKPVFGFGNIIQLMKKGFFKFELENRKKYGKTYGIFFVDSPCLVINDLDMIRQILVKDFWHFRNRVIYDVFGPNDPLYYALTMVRDEHWKHVRNTLSPSFTTGKLKMMDKQINWCADQLVCHVAEYAAKGESFELREMMGAYTMDVIASTGFGLQLDSHKNRDNKFIVHGKHLMTALVGSSKYLLPLFTPFLRKFWLKTTSIVPRDTSDFFKQITLNVINERKSKKSKKGIDFIQLMADELVEDNEPGRTVSNNGAVWNKKGLTKLDIIGNATIFLAAGFDTVSNTLCFVAYNLALNPDCQDKLLHEIDDTLNGKEPNYDDLPKLQYLQQIIDETLRLYPIAPRIDRSVESEITVNGLKLRRGMLIGIPVYVLHMDPEVWPDPEHFDPDRFKAEEKAKRDPLCYLPFGYGPRSCIGMRLALMEMKIAIVKLLQKYRFVTCEKTQIPLKLHPVRVMPLHGAWIKAEKRVKDLLLQENLF